MKLIQLIFVNIKRMLKDPMRVGILFVMPIAVILFVHFMDNDTGEEANPSSNLNVAINIEDNSGSHYLADMIHDFQSKSMWSFINEKEKALDLLETNEVAAVYNIPSDFTEKINNLEKPIIEAYKREEGNVTIPFELEMNNWINELIKEKLLIDKRVISSAEELYIGRTETVLQRNKKVITGDMTTAPMLMINFIILGASIIVNELIEFKKKNIISRATTTPNKSSTILGSIVLSILFFQVSANIMVLLISKLIIGFEIINLPIIIINVILASLFSITLSLATTRIFNNEATATTIIAIIGLSTMFLAMFAEPGTFAGIPKFVENLGKLTPQYWIFNSLERSVLFPNVFIVLLMIIALFTSGSFRLKDFANK